MKFFSMLFILLTAAAVANASDINIEVNIPATELTLYKDGMPLFRRRVAIGRGVYPTPTQESFITRIEWNPWWYPPPDAAWAKDAKPTPPGPDNPLGLVKMPLSDEILIHGTNNIYSVGEPASHGCMRMRNKEVTALAWYLQSNLSEKNDPTLKELYHANKHTTYVVKLGTHVPVKLIYKPVVVRDDVLVFYPDYYNRLPRNRKNVIIRALLDVGIDLEFVDDAVLDGIIAHWPPRATRVPVENILRNRQVPSLLDLPDCS